MKILTYKRTHVGDPRQGKFGVDDCMKRVRSYDYEAVIGIGGIKPWSGSENIAQKITWIGVGKHEEPTTKESGFPVISFDKFILMDENGPLLAAYAPQLAKRMYTHPAPRFILNREAYSDAEYKEAEGIVKKAIAGYFAKYEPSSKAYGGHSSHSACHGGKN